MMRVPPPSGAAIYKLVLIKPADDPGLAPDKGFGERVFWFDPDAVGHGSGLREVYPQPSPVEIGKVVAALIQKSQPPAPDVHGLTLQDRLNFIDRAEQIRVDLLKTAYRRQRGESEYTPQPRGLLTKAERARLFEGSLAEIRCILGAEGVVEQASVIAGQNDRAFSEEHRCDVIEAQGRLSDSVQSAQTSPSEAANGYE